MPNNQPTTFGDHLEELRRMLLRVLAATAVLAIVIFCFKEKTFLLLLAPSEWDFCTYRWIESAMQALGIDFHFERYQVDLIATDLSSQFMTHVTVSCLLAVIAASPYILYELFRFVSPALYHNERKYSLRLVIAIYLLFIVGTMATYFVLFPISFRFLGTYSVAAKIHSMITLSSYIETFTTLTFLMGVVFQLPVIAFFLGKMGVITSSMMARYRRHALVLLMIVAAIITPPDIITLIIVTIPLYLLFEVSIHIIKYTHPHT